MKRKSADSALISFLDVLCNALAAIFIISIVRLKPHALGAESEGLYYIQVINVTDANNTTKSKADSSLRIAVMLTTKDSMSAKPFYRESSDYFRTNNMRLYSNNSGARLTFLDEIESKEIERVIIYETNPSFDYPDNNQQYFVKIRLKGYTQPDDTITLHKYNYYRQEIKLLK